MNSGGSALLARARGVHAGHGHGPAPAGALSWCGRDFQMGQYYGNDPENGQFPHFTPPL